MPQYPEKIGAFKRWSKLKVDSGRVGLGDKKASLRKTRRRRRLKRIRRMRKNNEME